MFPSFEHRGDTLALIDEDGVRLSYRALDARVDAFCARFQKGCGLVLLECENGIPTLICYIAALRAGNPVFLMEAGRDAEAIRNSFSFLYHYNAATDDLQTSDLQRPIEIHADLAIILSTSGSTGDAKSVRLSTENIRSNAQAIATYLDITPSDCAPTTLPIYYSYGLSVINSHLCAGASVFLTSRSIRDPIFWTLFDQYQCTSFAGTPYSYDLLETDKIQTALRPSLRYATQAGGQLPAAQVTRWAKRSVAEGWRFFVMYGQTEAAPRMAFLPPEQAETHPDCIGLPIPGGALRLESEDGAVLQDAEETGELIYEGPNVMMGYASSDADLALGSQQGALRTGDLAQRTKDGYYRIIGRKNRFIKPFGLRVNLDAIEDWIAEQGVIGIATGRQEELWVFITDDGEINDLRSHMATWLNIPASSVNIHRIAAIPQTASGKTNYPALDPIIDALDSATPAHRASPLSLSAWRRFIPFVSFAPNQSVAAVFESHFPGQQINRQDSFQDLGGDSLSYVNVSLDLETVIGDLPENWETLTIDSLTASIQTGKSVYRRLEMATLLRFLAILLIVSVHFDLIPHVGSAGSFLLLMIAGFNFSIFQLDPVCRTGSVRPVLWLTLKVAIPSMAYITLFEIYADTLDFRTILLISNVLPNEASNGLSYWFIELYVQIMVIMALIFSIRPIRQIFRRYQFEASCGLFVLAVLAFTIARSFGGQPGQAPQILIWIFAIGVSARLSANFREKMVVTLMTFGAVFLFGGQSFLFSLFLIGTMLLIWRQSLRVPWWITRPIAEISGASLFIYLTHFQFRHLLHKVFDAPPVVDIAFVLLTGTLLWTIYNAAYKTLLKQAIPAWGRR